MILIWIWEITRELENLSRFCMDFCSYLCEPPRTDLMNERNDDPTENPANFKTRPVALPGFSIRPMTPGDLKTVARIERAVHVAPWTVQNIEEELEKSFCRFWLMTDDETDEVVAGYITFWVMMEECHILNVVSDLAFRGRGVAKFLVRKAIAEAEKSGCKRVILEVRKSNAAALGLYQTLGFTISHVRKAFYSNQEDAYSMILDLSDESQNSF